MKGDTININYQGKDFLIDIVDCKPDDQICVVEADIEVEFKAPLDYKEVPLVKKQSHFSIDDEEKQQQENHKKLKELETKFVRLDGKALTEKQKQELLKKDQVQQKQEEDFDPRQHRLKHGIRNYNKVEKSLMFEGKKGVSLK